MGDERAAGAWMRRRCLRSGRWLDGPPEFVPELEIGRRVAGGWRETAAPAAKGREDEAEAVADGDGGEE